jgi:hypothetical protein
MLIYPTLRYPNGGLELQHTSETRVPGLLIPGKQPSHPGKSDERHTTIRR